MQCYRFYKKPTNLEEMPERISLSDKYPLYALTANKKLAKQFKKERNMDMFIVQKSDIDKETYSVFANQNRSTVLEPCKLITCIDKYKKTQRMEDVELVLTYAERQVVEEGQLFIFEENWWRMYYANSPFIFKEEYVRALAKIDFIDFYKLYNSDVYLDQYDDYSVPNYYIDELAYFLSIYGDLMHFE